MPGDGFRASLSWLHTWAGVLLGGLLLAVFWSGSLAVFDREIDRWMLPSTRLGSPPVDLSLDRLVVPHAQRLAGTAGRWSITLPSERTPVIQLEFPNAEGVSTRRFIDPANGELLPDHGSWAATGFLFPFHYSLHLRWRNVGYWLLGIAGMGMLLLLVSGVVIHRKIIREFFTFRPHKSTQRATLDLHNLTGVVALPFHFLISLSGLIIFFAIYFPTVIERIYPGNSAAFSTEVFGNYTRRPSAEPATLASLDAMLDRAREAWGDEPYMLRVWHPGDAQAYVEVRRSFARQVTMNVDRMTFDGSSGALLLDHRTGPVAAIQRFFSGLHFVQFEHWTLRWLYFLGGLSGWVMIATGLLFWTGARRARHQRHGHTGAHLLDAICVCSCSGLILATLGFFIANRALPADVGRFEIDRAALEGWAFFLIWASTLVHALIRGAGAWHGQLLAIGVAAPTAVLLNWLTTGDHLLHSLQQGRDAVAGMDLLLMLLTLLALATARRLNRGIANG
ncbi:PepSY domain-containing protein [Stutzerimonas stutzeri]|nr:PepSY domain-containing protein [Stutzerimonas stutzeri]